VSARNFISIVRFFGRTQGSPLPFEEMFLKHIRTTSISEDFEHHTKEIEERLIESINKEEKSLLLELIEVYLAFA